MGEKLPLKMEINCSLVRPEWVPQMTGQGKASRPVLSFSFIKLAEVH
jgi:hypothetical protein